MHKDRARAFGKRPGFTLIEMLVVLGIILTLSVITVLFMPRVQERQKVARGADFLQEWFLMAKWRAIRDHAAIGIRLQPGDPPNTNYVRNLQYIQQPDEYAPSATYAADSLFIGPVDPKDPTKGYQFGPKVNLLGSGNLAASPGDESSLVQAGDYLQLRSEGLLHRISKVLGPQTCLLDSPTEIPPLPGCTFRIIRQPRLLAGEEPLQLPQDVAIDMSAGKSLNVPLRSWSGSGYAFWEILFSPKGTVTGQGTGSAPIALWVRDVTQDTTAPGDQILIVVYPRTGQIAAQSVAPGANAYQYILDGRSSGF